MHSSSFGRFARSLTALVALAASAAMSAPAPYDAAMPGIVTCATPDAWTGSARLSEVMPVAMRGSSDEREPPQVVSSHSVHVQQAHLSSSYRGDGLSTFHGAARARAQRRGVLWTLEGLPSGVSPRLMMDVLVRSGASGAARRGHVVYFRAKASDRERIVERAAASLPAGEGTTVTSSSSSVRIHRMSPQASFDVAMLRMQGRHSSDPMQFVDSLPSGVDVYPFGTSFAVRVPAYLVDGMWDQVDDQGERVLMVGAASAPVFGSQAAQAIRFCGGSALMRRFPTPTVLSQINDGLMVEAESQQVQLGLGDVLLVVQSPPSGRGVELALMRVVRR